MTFLMTHCHFCFPPPPDLALFPFINLNNPLVSVTIAIFAHSVGIAKVKVTVLMLKLTPRRKLA